jgi:hypothetical protein
MLTDLHYEDIKASIRKKWRTLKAFEEHAGLPLGGVNDYGRGKTSARVRRAIEQHLQSLIAPGIPAGIPDVSSESPGKHRLNRKAA